MGHMIKMCYSLFLLSWTKQQKIVFYGDPSVTSKRVVCKQILKSKQLSTYSTFIELE